MIERFRNKSVKFIMGTVAILTTTVALINALADFIELFMNDED